MKKLFTPKNMVIAAMAGWTAYSTGLPQAALSGISQGVAYVQTAQISRLADEVSNLEEAEMIIDDEIDAVESLAEIAGAEDQQKLGRRINHLNARKAQLFVEKGQTVEQIDELTQSQKQVIESRDVAMNYVGDSTELALSLRKEAQDRLVELQNELGSVEAVLVELESEKDRLAEEVVQERATRVQTVEKLQSLRDKEHAERLELEREILEVLRQRSVEGKSAKRARRKNPNGDIEDVSYEDRTARNAAFENVNYVVVRNSTPRVPSIFQKVASSRHTCR